MTRRIYTALATAMLLGSATHAGAFTLLSPPLIAPQGGSFDCEIYNHSSKTMQVKITILADGGGEVDGTTTSCDGANNAFCLRTASGAAAKSATACRFEVTQVSKNEVRAAVHTFDSAFNPVQALEAR